MYSLQRNNEERFIRKILQFLTHHASMFHSRYFQRCITQQQRLYNTSSFNSAISLLKLSDNREFSSKDLRDAYFTASKLCHPDLNKTKSQDELTDKFIQITEAYELLQRYNPKIKDISDDNLDDIDLSHIITKTEEQMYRDACRECLGLEAETVEESKKCALFRDWLKGKTDAAFTWSNFFMNHGGLAPMLRRKKKLSLGVGDYDGARRRRRSNTRSKR